MTISRSRIWSILLAGALVAPAPLFGQGQADSLRTHVVKVGDTLWSLAVSYLGNGQRWREILRLNSDVFTSQDSLPIGATIRIPPQRGPAAAARPATPPAREAPRQQPPPRAESPPPVRAEPPPPATAGPPPQRKPDSVRTGGAAPGGERTVFYGAKPGGAVAPVPADSSGTRVRTEAIAVPPPAAFELLSAPYVADAGALSGAGACLSLATGAEIASGATMGGALLHAAMTIAPPARAAVRDGDRLVLVRLAESIPGLGRVVVPTGVVRVIGDGSPRQAEVVAQFDAITCSDRLVLPGEAADPGLDVRPAWTGATGRVVWVNGDAILPSLQHAVIVDLGTVNGVRPGDQVTITGADGDVVATAAVVRVTRLSASAVIVRRPRAGVLAGLRARVTGKSP